MKRFPTLAASVLGLLAVALSAPAMADTTTARCDVFPKGEDKATSSGLCSFSQRQGFVSIQLKNGSRIELSPSGTTPDAYLDAQGKPVRREMLEANRGQIYRMAKQSIVVFWDPAPYKSHSTAH
jgi:hypothetical protein